jgi:hypothetical protein
MTARSGRTRGPHEVSRGRQWRTMTAGGEAHRAGDEAAVAATLRWPVVDKKCVWGVARRCPRLAREGRKRGEKKRRRRRGGPFIEARRGAEEGGTWCGRGRH